MQIRIPALWLLGSLMTAVALPEPETAALTEWFATPSATRAALPDALAAQTFGSAAAAKAAREAAWSAYQAGARKLGWDQEIAAMPPTLEAIAALPADQRPKLTPSAISAGGKTMPYFLVAKGTKPDGGWPLIISLHGGGGNADAKGPHEWAVNTREWQTQLALFERIYPANALYFIPRMADDREGRWWYDFCQEMYDQIIRRALLFRDVNPNRIYVMGISEGGYAAYRLPANQPDRWAAAGAMAAAEPLETSPPENLGQVAFRCDIGANDTMFDRITLARNYFKKLDELAKPDAARYVHQFGEQAGKGHGIDYQPCPEWIVKHSRQPRPKQLTWTVQKLHHTLNRHNFWLELAAEPTTLPLHLTGVISGNSIDLTARGADGQPAAGVKLKVVLDDDLVNLDAPVKVTLNGKTVHDAKLTRKLATMTRTLTDRGDPAMVFSAEIAIGD